MKANIFSALIAAALAVSAAAQDYGSLILNHQIATGMTYEGVVAAWGERLGGVRVLPGATELWFMKNGWTVVFENGKVSGFYQSNSTER